MITRGGAHHKPVADKCLRDVEGELRCSNGVCGPVIQRFVRIRHRRQAGACRKEASDRYVNVEPEVLVKGTSDDACDRDRAETTR